MKRSGMLERRKRDKIAAQTIGYARFLELSDTLQQEIIDAAFMAANDMFGMGPGRCEKFGNLIIQYRNEITNIINSDYRDDKDLTYAKAKIDERIKRICGEKFDPWDMRYGKKNRE